MSESLIDRVRDTTRPRRAAFRALTRFQVNVRLWEVDKLKAKGLICPYDPDLNLLGWFGAYDEDTGLTASLPDEILIG